MRIISFYFLKVLSFWTYLKFGNLLSEFLDLRSNSTHQMGLDQILQVTSESRRSVNQSCKTLWLGS